jgi:hypothetical protein
VAILDSLEDLLDICFWWLILTFKQLLALVFKSVSSREAVLKIDLSKPEVPT